MGFQNHRVYISKATGAEYYCAHVDAEYVAHMQQIYPSGERSPLLRKVSPFAFTNYCERTRREPDPPADVNGVRKL